MDSSPQAEPVRGKRQADTIVALLILAYVIALGTLSLLRYAALHNMADLATYSQVVWNTAHGDFFRNSVLPFSENYLGNHFTPILAFFVPFYLVWPDPRLLLLAQVMINALAAWPLYLFARESLPNTWAAVLVVAAFLLYPALHHQDLADFHGVALGTTAVMLAFYGLFTRRDHLVLISMPLMVLIREDLCLVIVMMGVYAFLFQRRRRFGLILTVLGLALSALVILVLIPSLRSGESFYYNDYYDYLGDSPLAMAQSLLLEPRVWLSRVLAPPKIKTLIQLLLPVAFLPLLAPSVFVLGGSALAYLLLVDLPFHHVYRLNSQYQALLIPFIFFGTVLGLAKLSRWLEPRLSDSRVALVGSAAVLVLTSLALLFWGPLADEAKRNEFRVSRQSQSEWALLQRIPARAGVLADDRFASPLSTREGFFFFNGLFEHEYPIDCLIYEDTPVGYRAHPPALLEGATAAGWQMPRYELVGSVGLTELRCQTGAITASILPTAIHFDDSIALRGTSGFGQALHATPGQTLEIPLVLESLVPNLPRLVPFVHLVESRSGAEYRWASIDKELYGGLFPSDKWHSGAIVGDVFALTIPSWLPPGRYELHTGLYTREGMERLALPDGRTTATIGEVEVAPPSAAMEESSADVPIQTDLIMADGLQLHGHTPIPDSIAVGQALDLTLFWKATAFMPRVYLARFDLIHSDSGSTIETWTQPLIQGEDTLASRFPNPEWPPGLVVADWQPLLLPNDLDPGVYDLFVTILDGDKPAGQPAHLKALEVRIDG
jgi:uncharacterized membrane protein